MKKAINPITGKEKKGSEFPAPRYSFGKNLSYHMDKYRPRKLNEV